MQQEHGRCKGKSTVHTRFSGNAVTNGNRYDEPIDVNSWTSKISLATQSIRLLILTASCVPRHSKWWKHVWRQPTPRNLERSRYIRQQYQSVTSVLMPPPEYFKDGTSNTILGQLLFHSWDFPSPETEAMQISPLGLLYLTAVGSQGWYNRSNDRFWERWFEFDSRQTRQSRSHGTHDMTQSLTLQWKSQCMAIAAFRSLPSEQLPGNYHTPSIITLRISQNKYTFDLME